MRPESDTPEQIKICLSCSRTECTNCLEYSLRNFSDESVANSGIRIPSSRIRRLYREGRTDVEIASELKCHRQTIYRWRMRNGYHVNRGSRSCPSRKETIT